MTENLGITRRLSEMKKVEYMRSVYLLKPTNSTTVEDMLKPDFWRSVSRQLRAGDRIEAVPDDQHYFAEFFILAVSNNGAKVTLMRKIDFIKDSSDKVDGEANN